MKTNKLVKLGIATFAVAVLGVVPAFTAQADTHVAEQPNTAQADTHVAEQPNTASKPVENGNPSDSEKPEVKPTEEAKPEAKSTANATETQPSDAPREDATLNEEKHLPIRYVIELDFKDIRTGEKVEPSKTLTGNVNFGEDLTIAAPTFEGYRLQRAYPKILNISYDNLNDISRSKDERFILTKEGDTIVAHCQLEYETLPLEKPNRSERTLHISFSYTGTPKLWPDGTLPLHRKAHSIDDGKRNITVTIKPGESFTLPKGDIDGYILEEITDVRHEEGRWGATTGNSYKPGETVPYEKFNFYPGVVDGVESDHISVNYFYYRPAGYIGYEKPSQPTEKPAPKADENQEPIKYRIDYFDADTGERLSREIGVLNPGETINIHKNIDGYEVVTNRRWMSGYNVDYRLMDRYFGSSSGYRYMFLEYKKVNADAKPSETPKPEVKPETKPSETPKPEVKPEPTPKADEKQEPINYLIEYFDAETGEEISREYGVLNSGETVNIHKNIDGYEVVSNDSWMPGYNVDYRIMSRYFGGQTFERYMFLDYKKVKADAKPSETPKPAPKDEEKQEPLKYRIDYFDADTGERISREIGVLNPGETINIYKDIEGYEVVSYASWMPGYKVDYRIMNTYFGGTLDDNYMYLKYKKVNADAKPSETPKPEVKPETKPSETPKPEVKPETKPSETPKPEVKPETKPSETPKPEVKPETKPSETPKPEVKPETKPSETPKPEVKPETKPSDTSKPEVKPAPKPSDTSKPEVKPETKPSDTSKPEVKPETKPSETPKPEVKPAPKPSETPKPVTPAVPDQPQSAKPEKPVTPSTSRILANEIGSVQVRASEETLKNVSYIKVEETKSNSLTAKNYKAYDIRLYDANGKAVQPNGMVLVSLSAEKPVENVYYVSPDGALQALDFKQDADKVTFETNHFSIYAMTFKNMSVNHNGGSIQTPVAGSENPTIPTQNSNGADGTQPQSKPLKTKGEGGEKTRKTLPNTGENSSILTTLFGVLTLNAGLFSYRKKEK
ncbi:LPXTG cell wall anchor domain-containing protein [uncultured Streptococcus sp.]|uniref:LPXTG cell wall anchor domain-containing protein n=1 Tax=uncultured Streptococcus sp. TaxID=83427 RepID=UPI0028896D77|nr:LPXTG cell wall anchor domain-containing protein [uncultured Streptococcus sp.]